MSFQHKKADLVIHTYVDDVISKVASMLGITVPPYVPEVDTTTYREQGFKNTHVVAGDWTLPSTCIEVKKGFSLTRVIFQCLSYTNGEGPLLPLKERRKRNLRPVKRGNDDGEDRKMTKHQTMTTSVRHSNLIQEVYARSQILSLTPSFVKVKEDTEPNSEIQGSGLHGIVSETMDEAAAVVFQPKPGIADVKTENDIVEFIEC